MSTKEYILLCCLFAYQITFGQECPLNAVSFRTQQHIDDFKINYPSCTEIDVNVNIHGDDIVSLSGLSEIKIIRGAISINNCPNLVDFKGLEKLEAIHGWVRIQDNSGLKSMAGLSSLRVLTGDYWYISRCNSLVDFSGLELLDSVHGIVHIFDNDSLQSLSGLDRLKYVGDNLSIFRNKNLTSLDGLGSLSSIGKDLRLDDNDNLVSIESLDHPVEIAGWLVIRNHPLLSICAIKSVCDHLSIAGSFRAFSGNGIGCESIAAVEAECLRTSVHEFGAEEIKIYPNPVVDRLYIEGVDLLPSFEVRVYNMSGMIFDLSANSNWMDVSQLIPGIYLLQLIWGKRVENHAFIKQ